MNFSKALELLKQGKAITRNGGIDFIFMQIPSRIEANVVPVITSLPEAIKDIFIERFKTEKIFQEQGIGVHYADHIQYINQFCIVSPSNIIQGWSPSPEDILSEEWRECHKVYKTEIKLTE